VKFFIRKPDIVVPAPEIGGIMPQEAFDGITEAVEYARQIAHVAAGDTVIGVGYLVEDGNPKIKIEKRGGQDWISNPGRAFRDVVLGAASPFLKCAQASGHLALYTKAWGVSMRDFSRPAQATLLHLNWHVDGLNPYDEGKIMNGIIAADALPPEFVTGEILADRSGFYNSNVYGINSTEESMREMNEGIATHLEEGDLRLVPPIPDGAMISYTRKHPHRVQAAVHKVDWTPEQPRRFIRITQLPDEQ
jgi:hypothetical protein